MTVVSISAYSLMVLGLTKYPCTPKLYASIMAAEAFTVDDNGNGIHFSRSLESSEILRFRSRPLMMPRFISHRIKKVLFSVVHMYSRNLKPLLKMMIWF